MTKAFISYSHLDEKALERLHTHLATLRRDGQLTAWFDRKILAGGEIDDEVASNLSDSAILLALVSPDFLASNYCYEREMEIALKRHDQGSLRVVPIILEACDWKSTPLGKLKALPKDGKPISTWTNENVAYLDVVTELRRVIVTSTADFSSRTNEEQSSAGSPHVRSQKKYRIQKEFDAIDRADFREKSFATIQRFFQSSIDELNQVDDLIRARFEQMSQSAFCCTVLNKGKRREAYITVHREGAFGEITYSFAHRAPNNTANGHIRVESDEYELYLTPEAFMRGFDKERLSAEEAAEKLWHEFLSNVGIDHE